MRMNDPQPSLSFPTTTNTKEQMKNYYYYYYYYYFLSFRIFSGILVNSGGLGYNYLSLPSSKPTSNPFTAFSRNVPAIICAYFFLVLSPPILSVPSLVSHPARKKRSIQTLQCSHPKTPCISNCSERPATACFALHSAC